MDGRRLGFPSDSLDVVSAFEVIEHLNEEDQRCLLGEIRRVLKPGGFFLLSTPNRVASGRRRMSPDHKRELNRAELEDLLVSRGFEIHEIYGQGFLGSRWDRRLFRMARENPPIAYFYYFILPWSLRRRARDLFFSTQEGTVVREVRANEIERVMIFFCQKR